jgi:hypothetical protein
MLAMAGYTQVFLDTTNTALSLTAYDLAEWLSLLPSERNASIPLLTPLFVRIHLEIFIICLMTMRISFPNQLRPIVVGLAFLLVIAQLPPIEFIANRQDINYQQQFFLALISIGLITLFLFTDYAKYLIHFALAFGILVLMIAIPHAQSLMNTYRLKTSIGLGAILLVLAYIGMFLWFWQQKRGSSSLPLSKTFTTANF